MRKQDFLARLRKGLSGLSQEDIKERLNFYSEMIDDRMEEGLSEEEAVAAVGSVDEIVPQIIADVPFSTLVRKKLKSKRRSGAGTTLLLILGSPVWVPLLIAAFVVGLSLYISLWAVVISLWAVEVSLWACTLGGTASGIIFALNSNVTAGIALIGCGSVCAGLSIFLFYGCKAAARGTVLAAKNTILATKRRLARKEAAL